MNRIIMRRRKISMLAAVIISAANIFSQSRNSENNRFVNAFDADSAVWTYLHGWVEPRIIGQTILYGDTIIDNEKWKIVTDFYIKKGLVRTEGEKVIIRSMKGQQSFGFFNKDNPEFFIQDTVYDFSLNVGDSALISYQYAYVDYPYINSYKFEIVSIDSILLYDGANHKVMNLGNFYYISLIEGLGSIGEIAHPFYMFISTPTGRYTSGPTLICCHVDGELLYMNPDYSDCDGNLVNNAIVNDISRKSIINLVNGQLIVKYKDDVFFDVTVINMLGKIIFKRQANMNITTIPFNENPKGVYVVRVTSNQYTESHKIINQ